MQEYVASPSSSEFRLEYVLNDCSNTMSRLAQPDLAVQGLDAYVLAASIRLSALQEKAKTTPTENANVMSLTQEALQHVQKTLPLAAQAVEARFNLEITSYCGSGAPSPIVPPGFDVRWCERRPYSTYGKYTLDGNAFATHLSTINGNGDCMNIAEVQAILDAQTADVKTYLNVAYNSQFPQVYSAFKPAWEAIPNWTKYIQQHQALTSHAGPTRPEG
jgi:hypothetical protein